MPINKIKGAIFLSPQKGLAAKCDFILLQASLPFYLQSCRVNYVIILIDKLSDR